MAPERSDDDVNLAIHSNWRSFRDFVEIFGAFQLFLLRILPHVPLGLLQPREIVRQIWILGGLSLVLIMFGGIFVGMVLALQAYQTLEQFGAGDSVGVFAMTALVRELGPVITALLFAGRAGTALAAEVGTMRATDQIAALEVMAVDPICHILVPRAVAGVVVVPLLAAIFSVMGLLGAYSVGVLIIGVDSGAFWAQLQHGFDLVDDVGTGVLKSFLFGGSATLMGLFEGYYATPSPEGVAQATTRAVVISSVWILLLDYLMTAFLAGGT